MTFKFPKNTDAYDKLLEGSSDELEEYLEKLHDAFIERGQLLREAVEILEKVDFVVHNQYPTISKNPSCDIHDLIARIKKEIGDD